MNARGAASILGRRAFDRFPGIGIHSLRSPAMVTPIGFVSRLLVVASFGALCVCGVAAERRTDFADACASLIRYDIPGGESLFALSLKADSIQTGAMKTGAKDKGRSAPHDHVILVDTSASQAGAHRQQGLKVVDSLLTALDKSDRVQIFAVDMQVNPLSEGFFCAAIGRDKDRAGRTAAACAAGSHQSAAGSGRGPQNICRPGQ